MREHGVFGRLYSGAGQTLEVVLADRLHLGRGGPDAPVLLTYVRGFVYIGIYSNNHHHLLLAVQRVNGATLWANLHLLLWLSLDPFATAWMGENRFDSWPVAVYGIVLLLAGIAYFILTRLSLAFMERAQLSQRLSDVIGKAKSQLQFML